VLRVVQVPLKLISALFSFCLAFAASASPVSAQADGVPKAAPTEKVDTEMTFSTVSTVGHALSLFGDIKYPSDFPHFDYVNPNAPKGGRLRLSSIGGFDSFNGFVVKGESAVGLGLTYDTLLESAYDEPATEYGLIAESVEVPDDYSWVTYTLREEARWHDGRPITPEDVIFSLDILKEKGLPFFRFYYGTIQEAKQIGPRQVKFIFTEAGNRELPQITGQLPILPKHYWKDKEFDRSTLEPPLSSGPYRVADFEANRRVVYERVPDYWGKDLPVKKGKFNFDEISFDYYRDQEVARTAFLANEFDRIAENSAKNWATRYDVPAVKEGLLKLSFFKSRQPSGMQAFFFNLRREKFQDIRVREAIGLAFNFEWLNKYIFYDQYTRTTSYFDNSELAAKGLPSEAELELLEPYRDQLPEKLFTQEFRVPETDGTGKYRDNLVRAIELLEEAGFFIRDGKMIDPRTDEPFFIEFLLVQPSFERVVQPFLRDLEKIGINGTIRVVGTAQYERRFENRDFDMIVYSARQSLSPGNEQRDFWGTDAADRPGSRNAAGVKSEVIDALVEKVIFAPDRESLVTATQALDRVLLWGHYVVPQWYLAGSRVAYWDRFGMPDEPPPYLPDDFSTWWSKDADGNQNTSFRDVGLRSGQTVEGDDLGEAE